MEELQLDLSYMKAAKVMIGEYKQLRLIVVGVGGTGSWLAPTVGRITRLLVDMGTPTSLALFDPDHVERDNIPRQNFCYAEEGRNKALTMAARISGAWGIQVDANPVAFTGNHIGDTHKNLTVLIGCVDRAEGRRQMHGSLRYNGETDAPRVMWLDCGNGYENGQVLVGMGWSASFLSKSFSTERVCRTLPSPGLVGPNLLVDEQPPAPAQRPNLSCQQMAVLNMQSLNVNRRTASEAEDMLTRLLFGELDRFRTSFSMATGSSHSDYITPENVAAACGLTPAYLLGEDLTEDMTEEEVYDDEDDDEDYEDNDGEVDFVDENAA